jgi:hypothetical protein
LYDVEYKEDVNAARNTTTTTSSAFDNGPHVTAAGHPPLVQQLVDMGFSKYAALLAVKRASTMQSALEWLIANESYVKEQEKLLREHRAAKKLMKKRM